MSLIELPITGGLVEVDQIASIRFVAASQHMLGRGPERYDFLPRVIIDTKQLVGAFIIECDTEEGARSVLKRVSDAAMAAK